MPGEDAEEYAAFMDSWFQGFAPATLPEAQCVALAGDCSWRLERLARVEAGLQRRRLDERLEESPLFQSLKLTRNAEAMISMMVSTITDRPVPPQRLSELTTLLDAVAGTIQALKAIPDLPEKPILEMELALESVWKKSDDKSVDCEAYTALGTVALRVGQVLLEKIEKEESALGPLREELACELLLLDTEDLRRLERHRRLLENSMRRQLEILRLVRAQVDCARTGDQERAQEFRVRLRLVK